MTTLEPGFEPTEFDVICARGRTAYNHEGNRKFRGILEQNLGKYVNATTKQQKTAVVNELLDEIKGQSRFVRKLAEGKWVEVPEHVAKEKIGQGFRDLLHTQYRSSTKSKVKLRRERRSRQKSPEGQSTLEAADSEVEGRTQSHKPTTSTDTFEPLPLDESARSAQPLIYDCPPFAFAGKEESKIADANDAIVYEEMEPKDEGATTAGKTEPKSENPAPYHETAQNDVNPTFVSPASPPSASPSRSHQPWVGEAPQREAPRTAWESYEERQHYMPPPNFSPPDYYHYSRHYYSPAHSSPPEHYGSHVPPLPHQYPPPPPPPQQYHHHNYPPWSPQGTAGVWSRNSHSYYSGQPGGYYTSPHPSWSYVPRDYGHPSPSDYYDPSRREEDRRGGGHGHYSYPPQDHRSYEPPP